MTVQVLEWRERIFCIWQVKAKCLLEVCASSSVFLKERRDLQCVYFFDRTTKNKELNK